MIKVDVDLYLHIMNEKGSLLDAIRSLIDERVAPIITAIDRSHEALMAQLEATLKDVANLQQLIDRVEKLDRSPDVPGTT